MYNIILQVHCLVHSVNVLSSQQNVIGTMNNTTLIPKIALNFILDIFGQFFGKITIWQRILFLKLKLNIKKCEYVTKIGLLNRCCLMKKY